MPESISRGCLHRARKISVAKAEQVRFAGFTCRNFGPFDAQVEIRRISEELKMSPSALFTVFNVYFSAELSHKQLVVTPNDRNSRPLFP